MRQDNVLTQAFGEHSGFAVAAMATGVMAVLAAAGLRALRVPLQHAAAAAHPLRGRRRIT